MAPVAPEARAAHQPVGRAAQPPQPIGVEVVTVRANRADGAEQLVGTDRAVRGAARALRVEAVLGVVVAAGDRALHPARHRGVRPVGLECRLYRLVEPHQASWDQRPQLGVVGDEVVLQSLHERSRDVGRHRGDEPQPVGRQPRREHRHREDARLPADPRAVTLHDALVGHGVRTAGVEDPARRLGQPGDRDEVGEQIGQRDGRRHRAYPRRRHHHRQVVHEVADHLVRRGPGADDHAGADLGYRHGALAQHVPGLRARQQVL